MPDVLDIIIPGDVVVLEIIAFQGAPGDPGPPGGAVYTHTQSTPATVWTIAHNLGFKPTIELLDTGGAEIEGEVIHLTANTAQANFTQAIAGTARCL